MKKGIAVENMAGEVLGFITKTAGGFFRAYSFIGVGVGPFFTASAARQFVWATANTSETPVEAFSDYIKRNAR